MNTYDVAGGAERISRELHLEYLRRGHDSWLLVGCKRGGVRQTVEIPNREGRKAWARTWAAVADTVAPLGRDVTLAWQLGRALTRLIGEPDRALARALGHEDFDYPGSLSIPDLVRGRPDVLHAHNLHGGALPDRGYFDLRLLPSLSGSFPLVLTLHDAWLLSGHCAHSLGHEGWETGCGDCPHLSVYPALRRDGTAYNWRRKRAIYARSRLHVATPCQWLMDMVERSILASGLVETRVIPYGVDLSAFRPGDREAARAELGLPLDVPILLLAANGIRRSEWKDYRTLRAALELVPRKVLFLALGDSGEPERAGQGEIRFVPYARDSARIARFYQAADLYVHAVLAETFPNAILEALASGTPVVASAVGGIPEQVTPETGVLVKTRDPEALARAIDELLRDETVRRSLGEAAVVDARRRYDLHRQADAYLEWYEDLVSRRPAMNR